MPSFWSKLGGDAKKLFHFMASPTGQTVIQLGEAGVEAAFPPATAIINIINRWAIKAIEVEGLAEAAGESNGTGLQKAQIVTTSITPLVINAMKDAGLPAPTAATLLSVNDDVVAIIKKLSGDVTVSNQAMNTGIAGAVAGK